jgi:sodium/bile acid cotransporter 7
LRRIDPYPWLLIGAVVLATVLPAAGGFARALPTITVAAVVLLLFLHGLRLSPAALRAGASHWRLHLLVLAVTFGLFPALVLALRSLLPGALPAPVWTGVVFLGLVPSTVQSSLAFTSEAGGNVAAAVCAATLSNLVGVVITPLYAALLLHAEGGGLDASKALTIAGEIVLPTILGQLARPWSEGWAARHPGLMRLADRGSILLIVYSAFSAAVARGLWHAAPPSVLASVLAVDAAILASVLALTYAAGGLPAFSRSDRVAIVFCGSKKSLATGAPIAGALLPAGTVGLAILPLMIFHQIQLMVCAWIAARWRRVQAVP